MTSEYLSWSYVVYFARYLKHLISTAVILSLSYSFSVDVSLPRSRVGADRVLYIRNLVFFWTLERFRTWLMISKLCKNVGILIAILLWSNMKIQIKPTTVPKNQYIKLHQGN
jgi:hypothetical protein